MSGLKKVEEFIPKPGRTSFRLDMDPSLKKRVLEAFASARLYTDEHVTEYEEGVFYRIRPLGLFGMSIPEASMATGLSVQMLYRVRNGQDRLSSNGEKLLCEMLGIPLVTYRIVTRYAMMENHRFTKDRSLQCSIPENLMSFFEPYVKRAGGPKTEAFRKMCEERKVTKKNPGGRRFFHSNDKEGSQNLPYEELKRLRMLAVKSGKRYVEIFKDQEAAASAGLDGGGRGSVPQDMESPDREGKG